MTAQCTLQLQVKRFEVHKSKVNDISIDTAVEFIASCSDDGSAAVSPSLPLSPTVLNFGIYARQRDCALGWRMQNFKTTPRQAIHRKGFIERDMKTDNS